MPIYAKNLYFINKGHHCSISIKFSSRFVLLDPKLVHSRADIETYDKNMSHETERLKEIETLSPRQ